MGAAGLGTGDAQRERAQAAQPQGDRAEKWLVCTAPLRRGPAATAPFQRVGARGSNPRAARGGAGQELRPIKPSARLLGPVPGARGSASSMKPLVAPNSQLILFLLIPQSSLSGLREPVCFPMNNTAQRGGCSGIM